VEESGPVLEVPLLPPLLLLPLLLPLWSRSLPPSSACSSMSSRATVPVELARWVRDPR
jgi:hypothetical protein